MTNEELKPCPFCGDIPEMWSCDRLITITCTKCNYHRTFDGVVSNKPSCVPVQYEGGEISSTEFYHPYAHKEAIETWNRRVEQQPCEDCISRAELLKAFETECAEECGCCDKHRDNGIMSFFGNYKSWCGLIAEFPPVTPTRPKGEWKVLDECANEGVYCSECHKKVFKLEFSHTMKWRNFKYCPNCGAKMEVEE